MQRRLLQCQKDLLRAYIQGDMMVTSYDSLDSKRQEEVLSKYDYSGVHNDINNFIFDFRRYEGNKAI